MDRRQFLASGGVAALATTLLPSSAFAQSTGDTALNAEFERIFQKSVARSPELATSLGLDKGLYRVAGQWKPAQFLTGRLMRLTSPVVTVRGSATFVDRVVDEGIATGLFDPRDRERALGFVTDAVFRFTNPVAVRLDADMPDDVIASRLAAAIRAVSTAKVLLMSGSLPVIPVTGRPPDGLDGRRPAPDRALLVHSPGLLSFP